MKTHDICGAVFLGIMEYVETQKEKEVRYGLRWQENWRKETA